MIFRLTLTNDRQLEISAETLQEAALAATDQYPDAEVISWAIIRDNQPEAPPAEETAETEGDGGSGDE